MWDLRVSPRGTPASPKRVPQPQQSRELGPSGVSGHITSSHAQGRPRSRVSYPWYGCPVGAWLPCVGWGEGAREDLQRATLQGAACRGSFPYGFCLPPRLWVPGSCTRASQVTARPRLQGHRGIEFWAPGSSRSHPRSPHPHFRLHIEKVWASQVAQRKRICVPVQETWVQPLGWEGPLQKETATHSGILAWKTAWTEEPGGLTFIGSLKSWALLRDWTTSPYNVSPAPSAENFSIMRSEKSEM